MTVRNTRTIIKWIIGLVVVLFVVGYAAYQLRNIIRGPKVVIESPLNGSTLSDPLIEITGMAANIAYMSLNDRQIFIDQSGRFSEKLLLFSGYNIMSLKARDKFGRQIEKRLELVLKTDSGL